FIFDTDSKKSEYSMIKKVLLPLLFVCFLISCQDTKSKKDQPSKPEKINQGTKGAKQNLSSAASRHTQPDNIDTITKVKQTDLIAFLKAYGQQNPETHALISTEFGEIEIQLFEDTPLHRANFIRLAKLGYFDGTYFYRVIKGFVIQAGNSDTKRTARMRKAIGKFLIPKEFHKRHLHSYGAVSMAKFSRQNVSKASSPFEFFIVVDKQGAHHLDFEHTVFGKVIKGMAVAEKIARAKTGSDDWPV